MSTYGVRPSRVATFTGAGLHRWPTFTDGGFHRCPHFRQEQAAIDARHLGTFLTSLLDKECSYTREEIAARLSPCALDPFYPDPRASFCAKSQPLAPLHHLAQQIHLDDQLSFSQNPQNNKRDVLHYSFILCAHSPTAIYASLTALHLNGALSCTFNVCYNNVRRWNTVGRERSNIIPAQEFGHDIVFTRST